MEDGTPGSRAVLVLPWGEGVGHLLGLGWAGGALQGLGEVSLCWGEDGKGFMSHFLAGRWHCCQAIK